MEQMSNHRCKSPCFDAPPPLTPIPPCSQPTPAERPPKPTAAGAELEARRRRGTDFFAAMRQAMPDVAGAAFGVAASTGGNRQGPFVPRSSPGLHDKVDGRGDLGGGDGGKGGKGRSPFIRSFSHTLLFGGKQTGGHSR